MRPLLPALAASLLLTVLCACASRTPDGHSGAADAPPRGLPHFAKVDDGLYRSGQPTAEGFAVAERLGIRTVVNLRSAHTDRPLLAGTHLGYVEIPCHQWSMDDADVAAFLQVATDPSMRPVLVHCAQGRDRTGLAVASYRVAVCGWSRADAEREMRTFGPNPLWGNLTSRLDHVEPMPSAVTR